jgi:hypothetical protein
MAMSIPPNAASNKPVSLTMVTGVALEIDGVGCRDG